MCMIKLMEIGSFVEVVFPKEALARLKLGKEESVCKSCERLRAKPSIKK